MKELTREHVEQGNFFITDSFYIEVMLPVQWSSLYHMGNPDREKGNRALPKYLECFHLTV